MKRDQLIVKLVELADESGLPVSEKVAALRIAQTRVQMNVSGTSKPQKIPWGKRPLPRPSGSLMGKQKSQPKEKG